MHTSILSALLAIPIVLAAPNFRLHAGTVRRSEREPREWRQEDTSTGSRFVRMDMRRKAPTHNLVPVPKNDVAAERRPMRTEDPITSTLGGPLPSGLTVITDSAITDSTIIISDDIGTSTGGFPSSLPTPGPARVNATAMLKDVAYGVKIWIGYPEQAVTLDFDTGSSETWVSPPCTPLSDMPLFEEICRKFGQYLPEHSQTGFHVDPNLCPNRWISYGSGAVYVSYYRDIIRVNDPETTFEAPMVLEKPIQFGVSGWAEGMDSGIMGVAYGAGYNQNYTGFIDALYNQDLISHKDFSVALGSVGKDEGEVVFGGIDKSKFVGPLHGLPIAQQYTLLEDGFYRYWLDVTYIGVTTPNSCTSIPLTNDTFSERFLPDTGTTLTYMPEEVFYALLNYFPDAQMEPSYGYILDCDHLQDTGSIDFGFGEFTIHVPIGEFIFQVPPMFDTDGSDTICVIGAVPTTDFFILGDTFLRSVVALFRQQEHKVYLGQYMDCGVNIVETHGNMSGMLGDCGNRRSPYKREAGTSPHGMGGEHGVNPNTNRWLEETQAFMTCATYLTGVYTPMSSAPWTSEIFGDGLFPRPAMQTVNHRQGPPETAATATAAWNDKSHPSVVKATTLVTHAALTLPKTTLSGTTEILLLQHTVTVDDTPNWTTTKCVTATTTEWAVETLASEYSSSSQYDSSSSSSYGVSFNCTSRHQHPKPTPTTCTAGGEETLSFSEYPSSSISSAMESYLSSTPTAITIPIQKDETVIVKLKTTTYSIVDGVSQTPASFVPEESSTATTTDWNPGATTTYTGGIFTNSSVPAMETTWESEIEPLSTSTTTGWSTTVSGEPDGYITAWSWTPDPGPSMTESVPPWVTTLVERGVRDCGCHGQWFCRCQLEAKETDEESNGAW